jgi:hypothetical protein
MPSRVAACPLHFASGCFGGAVTIEVEGWDYLPCNDHGLGTVSKAVPKQGSVSISSCRCEP